MVTHDAMVASYSNRVIYIRDGIIEKEILRENKEQKEFFYEIIEYISKESGYFFNK